MGRHCPHTWVQVPSLARRVRAPGAFKLCSGTGSGNSCFGETHHGRSNEPGTSDREFYWTFRAVTGPRGFGMPSAGITAGPAAHSPERKGARPRRARNESLFGDFSKSKLALNADTYA